MRSVSHSRARTGARAVVELARSAEEAGFEYAFISDHYHPWVDRAGLEPVRLERDRRHRRGDRGPEPQDRGYLPPIRIHPAIVAQAAATAACLMPGRFTLGVGTGENLNEHILGDPWPRQTCALEMFVEAIEVMRLLWEGGDAAIAASTTPSTAPGSTAFLKSPCASLSPQVGRTRPRSPEHGDALNSAPEPEVVEIFEAKGGGGKPRYGMMHCCWGENEDDALRDRARLWANIALKGELGRELPRPSDFEAPSDGLRKTWPKSSPAGRTRSATESTSRFEEAGYDHVFVHQIGPTRRASSASTRARFSRGSRPGCRPATLSRRAPVAQWIEQRVPELRPARELDLGFKKHTAGPRSSADRAPVS